MSDNVERTDQPRYEGKLESIAGGKVSGWIFDRNSPQHTIFVDIWVDGRRVCTVAANETWAQISGLASPRDGRNFSAHLPTWVNLDKSRNIRVSVLGRGPDVPGWSMRWEPSTAAEGAPKSNDVATFQSNVFFRLLSQQKEAKPGAKALIGKDGWLFLAHDSNAVIDQIQGRLQMKADQLLQYQRALQQRKEKFSELGIPYLFFAAPTKELVYSDKLPDGMRARLDERNFPLNRIISAVADGGFFIRPLLSVLASSRLQPRNTDVYHRTDTHWNLAGGHAAYDAILSEISETIGTIAPFKMSDFRFRKQINYRGDLADKAKVVFSPGQNKDLIVAADGEFASDAYSETVNVLEPSSLKYKNGVVDDYLKVSSTRETLVHENKSGVGPKIVIFHDSFMLDVMPFLSSHFSRSVYVWKPEPNFEIIEREKPDIVVSMMLDRFMRIPPALIQ